MPWWRGELLAVLEDAVSLGEDRKCSVLSGSHFWPFTTEHSFSGDLLMWQGYLQWLASFSWRLHMFPKGCKIMSGVTIPCCTSVTTAERASLSEPMLKGADLQSSHLSRKLKIKTRKDSSQGLWPFHTTCCYFGISARGLLWFEISSHGCTVYSSPLHPKHWEQQKQHWKNGSLFVLALAKWRLSTKLYLQNESILLNQDWNSVQIFVGT